MPTIDYVTNVKTTPIIGRAAEEYLRQVGGWQFSSELFGPLVTVEDDDEPLPSVNVAGAVWLAAGATITDEGGVTHVDPLRMVETVAARKVFVAIAHRLGVTGKQQEAARLRSRPETDPLWLHQWMVRQPSSELDELIPGLLRTL